ncbi:LAMI_0D04126g1_1 [Lachancea mirantina]|uniref:Ribosome-recycling factor, mitochondrial n=1 Tax=Lachancea mirantina TaxID=1230905 RepID=A0A1G4JAH8_9SACH|nr:LAMI_0D04126g1_1 [Lachancea mirantina]
MIRTRTIGYQALYISRPRGSELRNFYATPIAWKKNAKKGGKTKDNSKSQEQDGIETVDLSQYVQKASELFERTCELHKKRLGELKSGNANPSVFDHLKIGKSNAKFTDVATTSMKSRNSLLVTVFDPKDTKAVISGILAANLNLTPEPIPQNEQQLKVMLPAPTLESRKQTCKILKAVFEEYKNSASKTSLAHARGEILKDLKKLDRKSDAVNRTLQEIEKVHKQYTSKLQDQLKQAEKSVMG